jgi:hypothetical protein
MRTTRLLSVLVIASNMARSDAFSVPSFRSVEPHSELNPSRRSVLSGCAAALAVLACPVQPALAGSSASIQLPSYIDALIEQSKTVDPDTFLFKGADLQTQLGRIKKATTRLAEIPAIAEQQKWSQITGILTGPLGELLSTMTLVSAGNGKAKEAAKTVKLDLYAIGAGASQKNENACKQATQAALKDLEAFIKVAF